MTENGSDATTATVHENGWWDEVMAASERTSLAFLRDEPDIYTEDDDDS